MEPIHIAILIATVLMVVPLTLALANSRGWIPEAWWRVDRQPENTWVSKHPWAASVLFGGGYVLLAIFEYVRGGGSWWWPVALAVMWAIAPHAWARKWRRTDRTRDQPER